MTLVQKFCISIRKIYSTVSPTPTEPHSISIFFKIAPFKSSSFSLKQSSYNKMTAATYKKTALKVLVLWNLPALLLLAGAFQFGTSVIV